jgi:hypothetical protein
MARKMFIDELGTDAMDHNRVLIELELHDGKWGFGWSRGNAFGWGGYEYASQAEAMRAAGGWASECGWVAVFESGASLIPPLGGRE